MLRVFAVIFAAKVCLYYHQTKPKQQYFQYLTLINKWGGKKREIKNVHIVMNDLED